MKLGVSAFNLSFWQVFAGPRLASELRKGMRGCEAAEQPLVTLIIKIVEEFAKA
jgi:hypothetical protein